MANYAASEIGCIYHDPCMGKGARDGVRVNSLGVGPIETPIYGKTELSAEAAKTHKDMVARSVPLGRMGQPGRSGGRGCFPDGATKQVSSPDPTIKWTVA